jgi:hypothetical protein
MILRIRMTLRLLVKMKKSILAAELQSAISKSWPRADKSFQTAVATLRDKKKRPQLKPQLGAVGFTGDMLDGETSLLQKALSSRRVLCAKLPWPPSARVPWRPYCFFWSPRFDKKPDGQNMMRSFDFGRTVNRAT